MRGLCCREARGGEAPQLHALLVGEKGAEAMLYGDQAL